LTEEQSSAVHIQALYSACLPRVKQFNETIDEDDPQQPNWERAAKLFEKHFCS